MYFHKAFCSVMAGLTMMAVFAASAAASLPDSFGKWVGGAPLTITDRQLEEIAGQNAALIREYGFVGATRRDYSNGPNRATLTSWEMKDASGSLGYFTFLNVPGMNAEKFGEAVATFGQGFTYLWNGAYLVEIRGAEIAKGDLETLAKQLPTTEEQRALLPNLPSFFPSEDLMPMTRKYVLGPVGLERVLTRIAASKLGLQPGIEAAVAKYQMGGNTATMVLIFYPTPQLASKKFAEFLTLPELSGGSGPNHTLTQRKGSLVGIILDAPSIADATRLLDRVSYETNLMWNEYVPPQGQNVGSLILAVFALAGAVIVFALIAGVAFGGFRIFAKKYIPIPIFDRPVDTELVKLQLDRADQK